MKQKKLLLILLKSISLIGVTYAWEIGQFPEGVGS